MIGIINYRAGNLMNLKNALDYLQIKNKIFDRADHLLECDKIIIPGVGSFAHAMENFITFGFYDVIKEFIQSGKSVLGICAGMQILCSKGLEHGDHQGLDLIKGTVTKLQVDLKIPQIGWNRVESTDHFLFQNLSDSWFYFVHSYYCELANPQNQIGTTDYGIDFCSALSHENIHGVQFHPEKSHSNGLQLLKNFSVN